MQVSDLEITVACLGWPIAMALGVVVTRLRLKLIEKTTDHIETIGHSMGIINRHGQESRVLAARAQTFLAVVVDPAAAANEREVALGHLRKTLNCIGYAKDKENP